MQRFHQLLFVMSLLALSWFGMMAVHELGHVGGAILTGGSVRQVVLHPLTISRTDVSPNPSPGTVVWMGPIVGSVLPVVMLAGLRSRSQDLQFSARFFAGFCLIANGAYISIGWIDQVGDCGEMLRTGAPIWAMLAFGAVTIPPGLYLWHRLGSLRYFLQTPSLVTRRMAHSAAGVLAVLVVIEFALSPR
jgi:hypothetical protein